MRKVKKLYQKSKKHCCGDGATWSRHFYGGAGADFFVGRSQEPKPPFLRRLQLHLFGKQKRKALLL